MEYEIDLSTIESALEGIGEALSLVKNFQVGIMASICVLMGITLALIFFRKW